VGLLRRGLAHDVRPVHAVPGPNGTLYVSDDDAGNIYVVRYEGPRISDGGIVAHGDNLFELFGANLANDPAQFYLTANGQPAQVFYAGPTQVNFALPGGMTGRRPVSPSVLRGCAHSAYRRSAPARSRSCG
jgi:hypothetical protein